MNLSNVLSGQTGSDHYSRYFTPLMWVMIEMLASSYSELLFGFFVCSIIRKFNDRKQNVENDDWSQTTRKHKEYISKSRSKQIL